MPGVSREEGSMVAAVASAMISAAAASAADFREEVLMKGDPREMVG
jgi:hypothetical protein